MFGLFKLSQKEQAFLDSIHEALNNKHYTVKENKYSYYDNSSWHSFEILLTLANGYVLRVSDHSHGVGGCDMSFQDKNDSERYESVPDEFLSRKAAHAVSDYLKNLMRQEKEAKENEKNKKANDFSDSFSSEIKKIEIKTKMNQV